MPEWLPLTVYFSPTTRAHLETMAVRMQTAPHAVVTILVEQALRPYFGDPLAVCDACNELAPGHVPGCVRAIAAEAAAAGR